MIIYRLPFLTGVCLGLALAVKQTVIFFLPLYLIFFILRSENKITSLKNILIGFVCILIPMLGWAVFVSDKGLSIFFAIYKKKFFTPSSQGMQFMEWFEYEKFFTGDWITFIFSISVIIISMIILTSFALRKKINPKSYLEIITIFMFVAGYNFMISWFKYPLYSRYLLVMSSLYVVLFGIGFDLIFSGLISKIKIRFLKILIIITICGSWMLYANHNTKDFPDAANYNYSSAIKPCTEFIKQQDENVAIYYTDGTWPWIDWYFFTEKDAKRAELTPANFRSIAGIKQLYGRMEHDRDKINNNTVYFIVDPQRDKNIFRLIEDYTGSMPFYTKVYESYPPDKNSPSYIVYKIDKNGVLNFLDKSKKVSN